MNGGYGVPNGAYGQQSSSGVNMNGWADHNLNEDNFSEPQGVSVRSFDAFRMFLGLFGYSCFRGFSACRTRD
jgi:hypothetical protein